LLCKTQPLALISSAGGFLWKNAAISLKYIQKHKIELKFGVNSQISCKKIWWVWQKGVNLHQFSWY
jgi:hypothetical protein